MVDILLHSFCAFINKNSRFDTYLPNSYQRFLSVASNRTHLFNNIDYTVFDKNLVEKVDKSILKFNDIYLKLGEDYFRQYFLCTYLFIALIYSTMLYIKSGNKLSDYAKDDINSFCSLLTDVMGRKKNISYHGLLLYSEIISKKVIKL